MVTVPHIMVGLERMLDYRGVGLARFHCIYIQVIVTSFSNLVSKKLPSQTVQSDEQSNNAMECIKVRLGNLEVGGGRGMNQQTLDNHFYGL